MSADKTDVSPVNFDEVNAIGADAYIPFKSNATGEWGGIFQKAFHFFSLCMEEFLQSYHKQSNIESTFSMKKRKFGDTIRSKTEVAMTRSVTSV